MNLRSTQYAYVQPSWGTKLFWHVLVGTVLSILHALLAGGDTNQFLLTVAASPIITHILIKFWNYWASRENISAMEFLLRVVVALSVISLPIIIRGVSIAFHMYGNIIFAERLFVLRYQLSISIGFFILVFCGFFLWQERNSYV